MADPLRIGIIGCGNVGAGVVRIVMEKAELLAARAGRPIELAGIAVRDAKKSRPDWVPSRLVGDDGFALIRDPNIDAVLELVGGVELPRKMILEALERGKDVVTANKALLAEHGSEIFTAARRAGRSVGFEAAVAGGIPIVAALHQSLAGNQVTSIQAILNGTSNFILTAMAERGAGYAEALAEAQKLGYAEADPTLDVDGTDAAHKLAILAQIAYGVSPRLDQIDRQGIDGIDLMDLKFAAELGYSVKLLAEAWLDAGRVAIHVAPVLIREADLLGRVRGAFNAVQVTGDAVGETVFQGPGAGMMPTASAVVADVIDLASGRAALTAKAAPLWAGNDHRGFTLRPPEDVPTRFYLRIMVKDEAGRLAGVTGVLARHGISISSMIQHEPSGRSRRARSSRSSL